MSLLAPWFLAGLLSIGVPIAVHLINRERKSVVPFPSLMFLQRVPYKSVRRQKLRHLLLFSLRCLALFLFVAAFARPFFANARALEVIGGARERVILLDRSYSMGYGTRWDAARDSAKAAIGVMRPGDRVTLVAFATDAAALTEPTVDRAEVERAVDRATLSAEATRYGPALKFAGDLLAASSLPLREIIIVSDFQRRGWSSQAELRLPANVEIRAIDVSDKDVSDIAVTTVSSDRDGGATSGPVRVTARLSNTGTAAKSVEATLELAGRSIGSTRVSVPASGSAQVRFPPTAVPGGVTRGVVRIPDDALVANNTFSFTLAPDEALSVLVVDPVRPRANQSLFFRRALEIGDNPRFRVDVKRVDSLTPRDYVGRALVVLNEVPPPGGTLGAALRSEIRAGAGLVFVPGETPAARIPAEWDAVLRMGMVDGANRAGITGARIARVSYSSPVFEAFAAPGSGDFSSAHVMQHRTLQVVGDSGVLAWYDDGTPALVGRQHGLGRVIVWSTSLDDYWSNLPTQAVFLPFMRQLARHAGRYSDARAWFTAGEVLDITRHGELVVGLTGRAATSDATPSLTLVAPSGKRTRFSDSLSAAPLLERGFYELRGAATAEGAGRSIAVNVDLAESDLAHLEPAELVTAALASSGTLPGQATGATATSIEKERAQRVWWYLLIGAFLALAAETILSNRLSGVVST
ncbi:MAG: BatA and WFA domain-containing protein [Gemmatimonadetes bacterium]|nr:BatA and WFA domain-containing protein [Gemmatimonadota bacterium]